MFLIFVKLLVLGLVPSLTKTGPGLDTYQKDHPYYLTELYLKVDNLVVLMLIYLF